MYIRGKKGRFHEVKSPQIYTIYVNTVGMGGIWVGGVG